ncbi:hypothetical protein HGG75_11105 [Ochrobactrum pseudogrignonense]|nr:hypothetical protein [Brucella pseudogrignonensis]
MTLTTEFITDRTENIGIDFFKSCVEKALLACDMFHTLRLAGDSYMV